MAKKDYIKYVDPIDFRSFGFDGKNFKELSLSDKSYTVSRVFYEDITLYSFKLPKDQTEGDIASLVEIKMYEEAGLDLNKEYKITYIVKELDFDEMNLIEAFAVDISSVKAIFEDKIKKIKYIDFLALPFFGFTSLYKHEILAPKNDIFVYMDKDESFISFYKNGSYLSTKSLINISEISKKLENQGIQIDKDGLYEYLLTKGLDVESYESKDISVYNALEAVFSDILTKINNIAMHNRSVFGFESIERIFFSTRKGGIKGLDNFIKNFGFVDIDFSDFNILPVKKESDFLDSIIALYGFDKFKEKDNEQNVTVFHRKDPFLSTGFGKFVLSIILYVIVLGAGYGYLTFENQKLKDEKNALNLKYLSIQKTAKRYKSIISKNEKEIKKLEDKLKKQSLMYEGIKEGIEKLENLRNKELSYVGFLAKVNRLLARYGLKCRSMEQEGKRSMIVEVVSTYSQRDKISKFLKALIKEGFKGVSTNEIKLDEEKYISKIEIKDE